MPGGAVQGIAGKDHFIGGHIEFVAQGQAQQVPQIKAGKLRLIAPLSARRWQIAPDVPHIGELGYDPTFAYFSIWGPSGIPESVRSKLENAFRDAMKDQAFIDAARKMQVNIMYVPGKEYTELLKKMSPKYKKIVEELGLKQ